MCGIAWYLLDGLTANDIQRLKDMTARLSNRGPDGFELSVEAHQMWAFHRLAIINQAESGMQPFKSQRGSTLICNGEIYNYEDILEGKRDVRSDCEAIQVLLDKIEYDDNSSSWSAAAAAAIATLDGDFAFVYNDASSGTTLIARDHVGVRPLFMGLDVADSLRAVASEAKALVGAPGIHRVVVFPPGHLWDSRTLLLTDYTQLFVKAAHAISTREEAVRTVRALVTEAIRKRIDHSDRPVGILCSGGIDSSIIAYTVEALGAVDRIHVFTMEYEGARSEDAFYAGILCKRLGLKHTLVSFHRKDVIASIDRVVAACETYDPNTIRAAIPMYILAHTIAETTDVRVILSGEGADELFQGYSYFRLAPTEVDAQTEAKILVRNIHTFDLLRAERCFASAGLEVRVPFLDQALVRCVHSLPATFLRKGSFDDTEKQLLRDAFKDASCLVDTRIIDRPKEEFSDGCGFSYVPNLLADIGGMDGPTDPTSRLVNEGNLVGGTFDAMYPNHRHLIITRTMPWWTGIDGTASQQQQHLLSMYRE